MNYHMLTTCFLFIFLLASCSHTQPEVSPQGKEKTTSTKVLETGARVLQQSVPVNQLDVYLVGLHPMKALPNHQMRAHHFCRTVNEDFTQCVLFDGDSKDANLNGIEYIISEKLFNQLPEHEKKYWHPHNYEILSGQLIAPGLPSGAEKSFLRKKMNSYGKTWHVWNTGHEGLNDGHQIPLGEPMLAWSFNRDGEANPELLRKMEKDLKVSLKDKRAERKELAKDAHPQEGVDDLKGKFGRPTRKIDGVLEK